MIDFSVLKSIDFTNTDNLIFLAVFLIITIIIISVFIIIVKKIIKMIKRAVAGLFKTDIKKSKFEQQQENPDQLQEIKKVMSKPEQKIAVNPVVGNFNRGRTITETKMPVRPEAVPKNHTAPIVPAEIKIPRPENFSSGTSPYGNGQPPVAATNKNTNSSIFEGGQDVSKIKLEHKMRADSKVWQAARQEGLTLSPIERAKLVKEVFSPAQGRNISKTDLKFSIKKLNQKMLGAKDAQQHAKIRKEIKFFKKIGGIKN